MLCRTTGSLGGTVRRWRRKPPQRAVIQEKHQASLQRLSQKLWVLTHTLFNWNLQFPDFDDLHPCLIINSWISWKDAKRLTNGFPALQMLSAAVHLHLFCGQMSYSHNCQNGVSISIYTRFHLEISSVKFGGPLQGVREERIFIGPS